MNQDLQHIKLLSIFYYVVAGLLTLVACFPVIHLVIGLMMIVSPNTMTGTGGTPPPPELGWLFVLFAGGFILVGWTLAACLMFAGWYLSRCKHYMFCMSMAAIACLFNPFGTILGVFTIIVLIRPSVKRLFESDGMPDEPDERNELPIGYDDHLRRDSYDIRQ